MPGKETRESAIQVPSSESGSDGAGGGRVVGVVVGTVVDVVVGGVRKA